MNKTQATITGGIVGGIAGTVAGAAAMPTGVLMDLTAPVSYPICYGAYGYVLGCAMDADDKGKAISALIGVVGGACAVPLAPVQLLTYRPVQPLWTGLIGTVYGGAAGFFIHKEQDEVKKGLNEFKDETIEWLTKAYSEVSRALKTEKE
jgi:hypothetical protein